MGIRNLGLSLLSMLALAAFTPAQAFSFPTHALPGGGNTTVTYTNPDRAGEVVTVMIDNGKGEPPQRLEIQLDENGEGSEDWDVPSTWIVAVFVTNDVTESRPVDSGPTDSVDDFSDSDDARDVAGTVASWSSADHQALS